MLQRSKNIKNDFLGQLFQEFFQSETRLLFGTRCM